MGKRLPGDTPAEKLALNVKVDGECWRWTGAHTTRGYGQLKAGGKVLSVHRLAYELHKGPIPEGLEPDHTCNVRDCIRPDHLEAVSHQENVHRKIRRAEGREPFQPRAHCSKGHAMTGRNLAQYRSRGRIAYYCRECKKVSNAARVRKQVTDA